MFQSELSLNWISIDPVDSAVSAASHSSTYADLPSLRSTQEIFDVKTERLILKLPVPPDVSDGRCRVTLQAPPRYKYLQTCGVFRCSSSTRQ
ncbi:hypothetical protein INR49_014619, partial [Caranx melampygus]